MKKLNHVARALAFVSIAALMAGCKTPSMQDQVTGSIPNDYRLRHPIAVREKAQTLTVFIGDGKCISMGGPGDPVKVDVKYRPDFKGFRTYGSLGAQDRARHRG